MTLLAKKIYFIKLARMLFIFTLILFLSLALVAGETNVTLPIDSLSSEDISSTSLASSEEEILSLHLDFSSIYQNEIIIGEPVEMYQLITLTNTGDTVLFGTFSLHDYPKQIPFAYVDEALSITISSNGELLSQTANVELTLAPGEIKELYVDYTYVAVEQTLTCHMETIATILPAQAQVKSTTIGLGAELSEVCTLTLSHESTIHYYDVNVNLEGFDIEKITSIYYVQGDQYLELDGTQISVPKPEQ